MRLFLVKILVFFLLFILIDYSIAVVLNVIVPKISLGGTGRDNYICNKANEDILIFGSSRAEHHYNSDLISQELGKSCYNCGEAGAGSILAYGRLRMILERHKPQIIIYDITPNVDLVGDNYYKDLYRLKQHYERKGIDSIFIDIDPYEKIKMMSGIYRNNSSYLRHLLTYFFEVSTENGVKGFRALKGDMDIMKIKKSEGLNDEIHAETYKGADLVRLRYFNKFLDMAKDCNVYFVASPVWYGQDSTILEPIKKIANERNITFWDFSNNSKYVHNNSFFKDARHLNERGADEFTKDLIIALNSVDLSKHI